MSKKHTIDPSIGINDLVEQYPTLVDVLQEDYGFHCVNCVFSEFDTLKEGASLHGIEGADLDEMINHLESVLNEDPATLEISQEEV